LLVAAAMGGGLCVQRAFGQASVSILNIPGNGAADVQVLLPAGTIYAAMTTPLTSRATNLSTPDTILSFQISGGQEIINSDDAGIGADAIGSLAVGPVRGSAIRYATTIGGEYTAHITGYDASQFGLCAFTWMQLGGNSLFDFVETEPNNTPGTAMPLRVPPTGALVGYGALTPGDVDYYALTVSPGEVVSAMTIPLQSLPTDFSGPDTLLSVRNSVGTVITQNDDGGTDAIDWGQTSQALGSVVRFYAAGSGTLYLAVSGYAGAQSGDYALMVSRAPTPSLPGCPADFNHSGSATVQDLFDFLAVWFAGCP